MSTIRILTKQGKLVKIKVQEDVGEIWNRMNGDYGVNGFFNPNINREFILLTDTHGRPYIFHKRYCYEITDDTTKES